MMISLIHLLNVKLEKINILSLKLRAVLSLLINEEEDNKHYAEHFNDKFVVRFSYKISQVHRSRSHNYSNYVVISV